MIILHQKIYNNYNTLNNINKSSKAAQWMIISKSQTQYISDSEDIVHIYIWILVHCI